MKLALLLWLAAALTGAIYAVPRCNHLQLGFLFVLFAVMPPVVYAWRHGCLFRHSGRRRITAAPEK